MTEHEPASWSADSFIGGALCLDFANTVGGKTKDRSQSYLRRYADFLSWSRCVEAVDSDSADVLKRRAEQEPAEAARVLAHAVALREVLYRLFSATAAGHAPDDNDLADLNRAWLRVAQNAAIARGKAGFDWRWSGRAEDLERPLWPILRSATALMTGPELSLLKECGRCSWLFLDRSKNKRRRWCKMEVCGNRAKSQRRYRRVSGRSALD